MGPYKVNFPSTVKGSVHLLAALIMSALLDNKYCLFIFHVKICQSNFVKLSIRKSNEIILLDAGLLNRGSDTPVQYIGERVGMRPN